MRYTSEEELTRRASIYKAAMTARDPAWGPVEIADRAGLADHSQVSLIVRGKAAGSLPRIRAIAKVLGIPLSVLLDEDISAPDTKSLCGDAP